MLRISLRLAFVTASIIALPAFAATADDSQITRGKYLVTLGGCSDCHTPGYFFGNPDMSRYLGGSDVASVERVFELLKKAEVIFRVCGRLLVEQPFDLSLQHVFSGGLALREFSRSSDGLRVAAARAAGATQARAIPSSP